MTSKVLPFAIVVIIFASSLSSADDKRTEHNFKAELEAHFPEYDEIIEPFEYQRSSLHALERISGGVLAGDFNDDGITDFAAKISRPIRDDEIRKVYPGHRDIIKTVQVVVVCNGQKQSSYRCYKLSEEKIGGFSGTLDLFDWEWYLTTIDPDDQPACQDAIRSRIGSESLSLVEPAGHCDVFYYPSEDGGYGKCMFCAD